MNNNKHKPKLQLTSQASANKQNQGLHASWPFR